MPKAKKLKSGNWRVQVSTGQKINGKYNYKSFTAPTKKEAEYLASEFLFKRKEKPAIDLTFKKASEKYIQSKSNILSPPQLGGAE